MRGGAVRGGEGTVRCGVLATYYLLTTYSLPYILTRLVEAAVGEDMDEGRHGGGAQQQRRTELGS